MHCHLQVFVDHWCWGCFSNISKALIASLVSAEAAGVRIVPVSMFFGLCCEVGSNRFAMVDGGLLVFLQQIGHGKWWVL